MLGCPASVGINSDDGIGEAAELCNDLKVVVCAEFNFDDGHVWPLVDYVDADGALLLASDLATASQITDDGQITLPNQPGLGITLKDTP